MDQTDTSLVAQQDKDSLVFFYCAWYKVISKDGKLKLDTDNQNLAS